MSNCGPELNDFQCFMTDIGLYIAYAMVIIGALAALVFPIIYMAKHPAEGKKMLMGIGIVAVVFIISYLFASDAVLPSFEKHGVSSGESKLIGAGIITFYILAAVAVLGIIYTEITAMIKFKR